ncbi:MAG: prepilin peptidase [Acidobacteria bacterium]|nr:prepilin peptidase [Acidobacteriota bacterium]|tara:strand:+ start:166 stop:1002 length:837 start_codon:yes stop_codon:yes gene_type:complete
MTETYVQGLSVMALGLAIGSFLNVCIYRLPRGESVVSPPSRCPSCGRGLRWFDNVPVLSWLVLRGRCRDCSKPISPMYPLIEVTTGLVFALQFWELGWQPLLGVRLLFAAAMIVLFVVDLQSGHLPNEITYPGVVIGLGASLFLQPGIQSALIGAAAGAGVLLVPAVFYFLWRGVWAMGLGDVKMLAMVGAFLGWELMLVTLFAASLIPSLKLLLRLASILATIKDKVPPLKVLLHLAGIKDEVPLGPYLAASALLSSHFGGPFIRWYLESYYRFWFH